MILHCSSSSETTIERHLCVWWEMKTSFLASGSCKNLKWKKKSNCQTTYIFIYIWNEMFPLFSFYLSINEQHGTIVSAHKIFTHEVSSCSLTSTAVINMNICVWSLSHQEAFDYKIQPIVLNRTYRPELTLWV